MEEVQTNVSPYCFDFSFTKSVCECRRGIEKHKCRQDLMIFEGTKQHTVLTLHQRKGWLQKTAFLLQLLSYTH